VGDVDVSTGVTVVPVAVVAKFASVTVVSAITVTATANVTGAGIAATLTVAIDPPLRASGEIVGP
jgi:hypothetical protein